MNEDFEIADTADVNRANPCCCPEAECLYAEIQFQNRDSDLCKGGATPWFKNYDDPESYPNAFDILSVGKLMPLYKREVYSYLAEKNGEKSETWEYSSGHVVSQTFKFESTVNFSFTTTVDREYGQVKEFWPRGSEPLGYCPPESTIFAAEAVADGVKTLAAVDGIVQVVLSTPDVRPNHPTDVDEDGKPVKAGWFQFSVDGQTYGLSGPEFTINLNEGDTTCHEFSVRHLCGGNGKWSKPKVFSLKSNPCCKDPEPPGCGDYTEGNAIWSGTREYLQSGGNRWTSTYSNTSGGSSTDTGDTGCDDNGVSNIPPGLIGGIFGSIFIPQVALQYTLSTTADKVEFERTATENKTTLSWTVNRSGSNPLDPDVPDPPGWRGAMWNESGTARIVEKTTYSDDQNQGKSTIEQMFSTLLGKVKGYSKTYGWGITISGGWFDGGNARAVGGYPETQGGGFGGLAQLWVKIRECRFRWKVPDEHVGTTYKTKWNIGRFHDRWITWRAEYYEWAVKKYTFLHKPKPGDPDYPKLADFYNDPSTPVNEAQTALKEAIDAIKAIPDPGAAPPEPVELRPEIIGKQEIWEWTSSQGEQPDEAIDRCDPTKYSRELHEPTKPKRTDFGTEDLFKAAVESYKTALAAYKAAVAKRKADSKRQSPWFIITPDKWSDWRGKPDPVPDLPKTPPPTESDRKAHALAVKRYDFLLGRYKSEPHSGLYVCNVRHICLESPYGTIENTDFRFPNTKLPTLDPTKEDPARWDDWY